MCVCVCALYIVLSETITDFAVAMPPLPLVRFAGIDADTAVVIRAHIIPVVLFAYARITIRDMFVCIVFVACNYVICLSRSLRTATVVRFRLRSSDSARAFRLAVGRATGAHDCRTLFRRPRRVSRRPGQR